jgi:hypothetical protein
MQQLSLRKKIQNATLITNCFTKPAQRKQTPQTLSPRTLIGGTAFLFTAAKNSDP